MEVLVVKGLADQIAKLEHIVRYAIGQVGVFGLVPDGFDWIEIGCVRRQPLDAEPIGSSLLKLSHSRPMYVQAVADQNDRPTGHAPQFQDEGQEVGRLHVVVTNREVQRQPARAWPKQ